MKIKLIIFNILIFLIFLCVFNISLLAQIDSLKIEDTPIIIGDSLSIADSLKTKLPPKAFLISFDDKFSDTLISTFDISKKEIDKLDYRYVGNILSYLPFSRIRDFGYLGAPNEPSLFTFGYGNFSLISDDFYFSNGWNNSNDLNKIQTESISSFKVEPLHRSFLFGMNNNPVALNIITSDSIKNKPISRIRYYQASYDEGFIDAFFSARVLPRFAIALRVTNSSIGNNYTNSNFGSWKAHVKGIYKLSDSLFSKINYYHLKLNTALNGGIDVNELLINPLATNNTIYSNQAPVFYSTLSNTKTSNTLSASLYGNFIPTGYTEISFSYSHNKDQYKRVLNDSLKINFENKYSVLASKIKYDIKFDKFSSTISAGYEQIDFNIEGINFDDKQNSFFTSAILNYSFFNGLLKPSLMGKYSKYDSQSNNGFGIDLVLNTHKNIKFLLGFSNFDKPFSIIESVYLPNKIESNYTTMFSSIELNSKITNSSISYFNMKSKNTPIPLFNNSDIRLPTSEIIFRNTEDINTSGVNINANLELWNILITSNFNYYWQSDNSLIPQEANFNLTSGLYYVDTLFNSNLDLKTGFTFYLFDNLSYRVYDFQKMRSTGYYLDNNIVRQFNYYDIENDNYRIDFLLAGRIQDAATFYFIFENILGNNYFVVPYYPMPEGGIKIGISWDFLD